jgi:hypothetical protein
MTTVKRATLLLVFFAGCGASQAARYAVPVARAGTTTAQRWEYRCLRANDNVGAESNRYGAEGWELAAAAGAGWGSGLLSEHEMIWCFKRPLE